MSFTADIEIEVAGVKQKKIVLDPTKGRANDERFWDVLPGIQKRVQNLKPVWGAVHEMLLDESKGVFKSQGSSIGKTWPKYNADEAGYVAYKSKFVPNVQNSLMRWRPKRERLYPSLTSRSHKEHVWKTTRQSFEYGTSVPYAKGIDAGTAPGWKGKYTQPKRKLLGISKSGFGQILSTTQLYIIRGEVSARGGMLRGGSFA